MMKKPNFFHFILLISILPVMSSCAYSTEAAVSSARVVMVIHGGAGTITRANMTSGKESAYRKKLTESLHTGYKALMSGKTSVDAVQAAINVMEDSPLFNAGKGAVFTHDGKNEMDAAIMNGANLMAGSVAGVTTVKNPIDAARAVMEQSKHVMLAGRGAEKFAKEAGCTLVDPAYFYTERRWKSLQRALKRDKKRKSTSKDGKDYSQEDMTRNKDQHFGTVGCVALDQSGNIAAGTSTGGLTDKKNGRIGDSPIIGAGTYANNLTAGISCTGQGEYFIREVAAYRVSALMELKGLSINEAAHKVIDEIGEMGGTGGMIGLDTKGEVAMTFNTAGMYRGTIDENGTVKIFFYGVDTE